MKTTCRNRRQSASEVTHLFLKYLPFIGCKFPGIWYKQDKCYHESGSALIFPSLFRANFSTPPSFLPLMIPARWNLQTKANRCCSESRRWIMAHCIFCHSNLTNEQATYQCSDQTAEMSPHLRLCFVSSLCSCCFCLAHCYPALDSLWSVRCTSPANVLVKWRCSLKSWSGIIILFFFFYKYIYRTKDICDMICQ